MSRDFIFTWFILYGHLGVAAEQHIWSSFQLMKKKYTSGASFCGGICSLIIVKFFFSLLLLLRPVRANTLHFHLADAFVRIHTYIQTLMAVAAVQGANQNIRSSSVFWTHQHADQRNCTSNLLITRCWLYPWATTALNTQHYPHVRKDHFSNICYYTASLSYNATKMSVVSCNDGPKATLIMMFQKQ